MHICKYVYKYVSSQLPNIRTLCHYFVIITKRRFEQYDIDSCHCSTSLLLVTGRPKLLRHARSGGNFSPATPACDRKVTFQFAPNCNPRPTLLKGRVVCDYVTTDRLLFNLPIKDICSGSGQGRR